MVLTFFQKSFKNQLTGRKCFAIKGARKALPSGIARTDGLLFDIVNPFVWAPCKEPDMNNLTLSFAGHSVEWNDLPENSQAALAALGFSTKIKNSVAGVKAGILGTAKEPWSEDELRAAAEEYGLVTSLESGDMDAFAKAVCDAMQKAMFDAIVSGIEPSSRRGGARLSDDEKLRLSIEIELLEKAAKAKGVALPKRSKADEKEAFEALLGKARTQPKFADAVEKEFTKRKNAKAIEIDLDF